MAKEINEDNLINLINKNELYKQVKNNSISNADTQKFIDAIFENYYLDNDNINFLVKNNINFFSLEDNELCFCLTGKTFANCCKAKLAKKNDNKYKPLWKAMLNKKDLEEYVNYSNELYEKVTKEFLKNSNCYFPKCSSKAIKNNLYNIDFTRKEYVTSVNKNPAISLYKMGDIFFNDLKKDDFEYIGLCKKHEEEINSILIDKKSTDEEIIMSNFSTVIYKLYLSRIHLDIIKKEFLQNFNNIEEEGFRSLFIYNLKKVSNSLRSTLKNYLFYKDLIEKNNQNYKLLKFSLPKTDLFLIKDFIYPQICPVNFKVINSVNNIFVEEKSAILSVTNNKISSFISIIFNSEDKQLLEFFNQYMKIIQNKNKFEAAFISNCSLILANNILFEKSWFDDLPEEQKKLYSALNKFRLENPEMGQEYLKMQFFAGFHKGNNFF